MMVAAKSRAIRKPKSPMLPTWAYRSVNTILPQIRASGRRKAWTGRDVHPIRQVQAEVSSRPVSGFPPQVCPRVARYVMLERLRKLNVGLFEMRRRSILGPRSRKSRSNFQLGTMGQPGDDNQVTDRTYPIPAQQQLHTSNGSPSTLIQRPVRFVSHPNRP
jgi:hypothetical protein